MSAYMVDPETLHVLIHAAIHRGDAGDPMTWASHAEPNHDGSNGVRNGFGGTRYRVGMRGTEAHVGQMLLDANADSIDALYRVEEQYVYAYQRPRHLDWSPVELLGILNNYEYQACETENWDTSEAYRFCCSLRRRIESMLPGAQDAPWGVSPDDAPAHVIAARETRAERATRDRR